MASALDKKGGKLMPLYEINCPKCGTKEIFAKQATGMTEGPCPECGEWSPRNWQSCGSPYEFRSYFSDSLSVGEDPVWVTSREQERRLCKELECERI